MNLVDLAGSERVKNTGAAGARLKVWQTMLLILGRSGVHQIEGRTYVYIIKEHGSKST